jgi:hypothetical protein
MSISLTQQRCVCRLGVSASPSHHKPTIARNILKRETLAQAATQRTGATIEINPDVELGAGNSKESEL